MSKEEQKLFKKIIYQYDVKPPILTMTAKKYQEPNSEKKGDKKRKKQSEFPIFKTKNTYFVVVKEKHEIKEAKIIAEKYNAQIVTLEKFLIKNN